MGPSKTHAAIAEPRPWGRALAWLIFLGPFFFLTYGFATWTATQRATVPSFPFAWESNIPFWSWTILPYWSIDLLYGLSLFVCTTRRELDTHAKRLLTAQIIAVACFVLVPLRFSFARPAVDGLSGHMFDVLTAFDQPFNQLPSLHIALAAILWALYARKLEGLARRAMEVWFLLICISVLTTYQHHFIDLPTGLLLGAFCMWLWPFAEEGDGRSIAAHWQWTRDPKRRRIAAFYAVGACVAAAIATGIGGSALWLLWVGAALALVALAYAWIGASAFQKSADGKMSVAARWLFAPFIAGAWINSRAWTWREPHSVAIADGVFLGRVPTAAELAVSPFMGVVDLTAEFELAAGHRAHTVIATLDLMPPDALALAQAAQAIERLHAQGPVLVCCALGYSRSACAVAAWMLYSGRAREVNAAIALVRAARARVVLGASHAEMLRRYISLPERPLAAVSEQSAD